MNLRFLVAAGGVGLLVVALAWIAAGGGRKVLTSHYPSGLGLSARGLEGDLADGAWIAWHPDRAVAAEQRYRRGQRSGRWATYSAPDAELRRPQVLLFERHYREDRLHGPFVRRWLNGELMVEGRFEAGRRAGTWRHYDASGVLLEERVYPAVEGEPRAHAPD